MLQVIWVYATDKEIIHSLFILSINIQAKFEYAEDQGLFKIFMEPEGYTISHMACRVLQTQDTINPDVWWKHKANEFISKSLDIKLMKQHYFYIHLYKKRYTPLHIYRNAL